MLPWKALMNTTVPSIKILILIARPDSARVGLVLAIFHLSLFVFVEALNFFRYPRPHRTCVVKLGTHLLRYRAPSHSTLIT